MEVTRLIILYFSEWQDSERHFPSICFDLYLWEEHTLLWEKTSFRVFTLPLPPGRAEPRPVCTVPHTIKEVFDLSVVAMSFEDTGHDNSFLVQHLPVSYERSLPREMGTQRLVPREPAGSDFPWGPVLTDPSLGAKEGDLRKGTKGQQATAMAVSRKVDANVLFIF